MPTPLGPVPPDPNDPDLCDWGNEDDGLRPPRRPLRLLVIGVIVLALVFLLVVNLL